MLTSVFGPEARTVFSDANTPRRKQVRVNGGTQEITTPFPSPTDWRDHWIYFLMIDRFNNPDKAPQSTLQSPPISFEGPFNAFQGGTFAGIRQKLSYIRDLGATAIWLSPVLKNCQYETGTFHGYGIQDFLHAEPRFCSNPTAAASDPSVADGELRDLIDAIHASGMYAIFDIVLNHTGNIFGYVVDGSNNAPEAPFRSSVYDIRWHDETGQPVFGDFPSGPTPLSRDAVVWPQELQNNQRFRRMGRADDSIRALGDFQSLKQMVSEEIDVQNILIRAYQYIIARFDCDGFRIDTFKVPDPTFGHNFCASMREFALSIGKENFFTFGEITVGENDLRGFIGRDTWAQNQDTIGIDAALDFPLEGTLGSVVKHLSPGPPTFLSDLYQARKIAERTIITTHGEASGFFVTFIDNHDRHQRFFFVDPANPNRWAGQLTLVLGALFALQGIPCLYYGTEQGLHGGGDSDGYVREALWGKSSAFDTAHPFYVAIRQIAGVRNTQPALRYGRQYFRQISGNQHDFAVSTFSPGVIAFSRILNDQEVLIIGNTSDSFTFSGEVIVDMELNPAPGTLRVLFSNVSSPAPPGQLRTAAQGSVSIRELDGRVSIGPARVIPVTLAPLELQILRR